MSGKCFFEVCVFFLLVAMARVYQLPPPAHMKKTAPAGVPPPPPPQAPFGCSPPHQRPLRSSAFIEQVRPRTVQRQFRNHVAFCQARARSQHVCQESKDLKLLPRSCSVLSAQANSTARRDLLGHVLLQRLQSEMQPSHAHMKETASAGLPPQPPPQVTSGVLRPPPPPAPSVSLPTPPCPDQSVAFKEKVCTSTVARQIRDHVTCRQVRTHPHHICQGSKDLRHLPRPCSLLLPQAKKKSRRDPSGHVELQRLESKMVCEDQVASSKSKCCIVSRRSYRETKESMRKKNSSEFSNASLRASIYKVEEEPSTTTFRLVKPSAKRECQDRKRIHSEVFDVAKKTLGLEQKVEEDGSSGAGGDNENGFSSFHGNGEQEVFTPPTPPRKMQVAEDRVRGEPAMRCTQKAKKSGKFVKDELDDPCPSCRCKKSCRMGAFERLCVLNVELNDCASQGWNFENLDCFRSFLKASFFFRAFRAFVLFLSCFSVCICVFFSALHFNSGGVRLPLNCRRHSSARESI